VSELTAKQAKILAFIKDYIAKNQMPPTQTEIASKFRFTQTAARHHLIALHKRSAIQLTPAISRGIKVLAYE
jgi:repressor LexA